MDRPAGIDIPASDYFAERSAIPRRSAGRLSTAEIAGTVGSTASSIAAEVSAAGIRLVVWDFDLTILRIHSFATRLTAADVASRDLSLDFWDLPFFITLAQHLVRLGVAVAIASFGRSEVIQAYLDRAFEPPDEGARLFSSTTNIVTPATVGGVDGWAQPGGKNSLLEHLLVGVFPGITKNAVLFFDDDNTNVELAKEAGFQRSVHCPQGFSSATWKQTASSILPLYHDESVAASHDGVQSSDPLPPVAASSASTPSFTSSSVADRDGALVSLPPPGLPL